MIRIHWCGGIAGGVGKSTVCFAMIAFLEALKVSCIIVDSDRDKPDVYRAHKDIGCRRAILSEAERFENGANAIFEAAVEEQKPVLVNLAASSFNALCSWVENADLLLLAQEYDIRFTYWFVLDGTPTSSTLLKRALKHFDGGIDFIAVKNYGKSNDWRIVDGDADLATLLEQYQVPVVSFPKFHGEAERQAILDKRLSLLKAARSPEFGIISRQRVKKFLRESAEAFDHAGMW
ncbi:hypothetical protein PN498_13195 [Oscillatoria sp. CS-180]|uniref:hypothetical protein n=1 Tax=Oscillatoria sp. CS-180 TaxID=3021720 RepID=UPI00232F082B|nr:hypothetical protein [Oscillatoria sp. CS-180]MDB9526949.1 hypothetical protein [Oscillatoria sp. CS-180]